MKNDAIAKGAAEWALSKVGCAYSQVNRNHEKIFDCSSLVARAYTAQGKKWMYGGSVPLSNQEPYDDEFELIWPEAYEDIGKKFGGRTVINKAVKPGDLQFLCTDADTSRTNQITHVAMVANAGKIVHARGKQYGVCTNSIHHYSGKVCALTRYNPVGNLKRGMKGYRTLMLQRKLNTMGAGLEEDGDFGSKTENAVTDWQIKNGLLSTGQANETMLKKLGLLMEEVSSEELSSNCALIVTGDSVNIRSGPGKEYPPIGIAHKNDTFEAVNTGEWQPVIVDGNIRWISLKYAAFSKDVE